MHSAHSPTQGHAVSPFAAISADIPPAAHLARAWACGCLLLLSGPWAGRAAI